MPLLDRESSIELLRSIWPNWMSYFPGSVEYIRARERSIELLRSWLTPGQLADYDAGQRFIVRGSDTGERYLIVSADQAYNIWELDDNDKVVLRLCFVPRGVSAVGDVMLAQKIMLETDELEARAIANRRALVDTDVFV